ncbi:B-(1-6) glucan synthase [Daedaleopsis nitida]|nr:B-(1-6) glucan synthase [Daedaleopsis nitida]
MPQDAPSDLTNWWCDPSTEYAFVGFSYEISACEHAATLKNDFANIRKTYNGRYIRLYGTCDKYGYYNNVVDAAWEAGLGVHALVWFGFTGGDQWKHRRDDLFATLHSNPKAKFVTRVVQFGSEPLYDEVLPAIQLAEQVKEAQASLASLQIPVTISEMSYGYQTNNNAGLKTVMDVVDPIDAHMLPFFGATASTAKASWKYIQNDIDNFWVKHAKGKKIYLTENGWPSKVDNASQKPNSLGAVASVQQERDYFDLLDSQCEYFKNVPGGGVGWFAHIYSDSQEPGYGILDTSGKEKFSFRPRTQC